MHIALYPYYLSLVVAREQMADDCFRPCLGPTGCR